MKSFAQGSYRIAGLLAAALLLPAVASATNLEPRASDTLVETDEDVPLDFSFNATDFETPSLGFTTDSLGLLGTISGTAADVARLLPALNANGETTVNYTVNDGEFSATARLTVRIRPVNDLPQAAAGELSLDEDSSLAIILDAEDPEGDLVISEVITPPAHGTLLIDGIAPNYRYTPDPNYFGPDSFTYALGDALGSTQATVTLIVAAVADAPVAGLVADLTMNEDSVGTQTVSATDPDGRYLIYLLDAAPTVGRLDLDPLSGSVSFRPPTNFVGTVSYSWHATARTLVRDPDTGLYVWVAAAGALSSAPDTVSIIVVPVNDDDDGDTILDLSDNCPLVSNTDQANLDGDLVGDACDEDLDGDTIVNLEDNCPAAANGDQANADTDPAGDACDLDDDGDGWDDLEDNCPLVANADQADLNSDGTGNLCDDDKDGDGVLDAADNCELVANAEQANLDLDLLGDLCDLDDDGDTIADSADNCPLVSNSDQANLDLDGEGDLCDLDDDGDGVNDLDDACPTTSGDGPDGCPLATDAGSDTTPDDTGTDTGTDAGADTTVTDAGADTAVDTGPDTGPVAPDLDRDGIVDSLDTCPSRYNPDQTDGDADGRGDVCDNCPRRANSSQTDNDNDGLGDNCDNCAVNPNPDQADMDGDNTGDVCDGPDQVVLPGCDCSTGNSAIGSTLLLALFAVAGLFWRRKPRATVGR